MSKAWEARRPRVRRFTRVAVAIALAWAPAGCVTTGPAARVGVESVRGRVEGISGEGVDLVFDVAVRNSGASALRSPTVSYAVESGGRRHFVGDSAPQGDLGGRSSAILQLPARLNYGDLIRADPALAQANEVPYRLTGTLRGAGAGSEETPISIDGKAPRLRAPTLEITNTLPVEFSWDKARISVEATATNPNVFEIVLDEMECDLMHVKLRVAHLTTTAGVRIAPGKSAPVALEGDVTNIEAFRQIYDGHGLSKLKLVPTGKLGTPYGPAELAK